MSIFKGTCTFLLINLTTLVGVAQDLDYQCDYEVLDKTLLYETGSSSNPFGVAWYLVRYYEFYTAQSITNVQNDPYIDEYGLYFRNEDEYHFFRLGLNKEGEFEVNSTTNELVLYNYSSDLFPEIFEILDLDSVRLLLYNETFCPDTCLLIRGDKREAFYESLCQESSCGNFIDNCERGLCDCPFGTIGKNCESEEEYFPIPNQSYFKREIPTRQGDFIIQTDIDGLSNYTMSIDESGNKVWGNDNPKFQNYYGQVTPENFIYNLQVDSIHSLNLLNGSVQSNELDSILHPNDLTRFNSLHNNSIIGLIDSKIRLINFAGEFVWELPWQYGEIFFVNSDSDIIEIFTEENRKILIDYQGTIVSNDILVDIDMNEVTTMFSSESSIYTYNHNLGNESEFHRYDKNGVLIWSNSNYLYPHIYFQSIQFFEELDENTLLIFDNPGLFIIDNDDGKIICSYHLNGTELNNKLNGWSIREITNDYIEFWSTPTGFQPEYVTKVKLKYSDFHKQIPICTFGNTISSNITLSNPEFDVFPIPTNNYLFFEDCNNFYNYQLFSVQGNLVRSGNITCEGISVRDFKEGIYLLVVTDDKGISFVPKKVVIANK